MMRANAHYAGRQLASINQFALAGPTRSRGYKTNMAFADDGLHLGFDLLFEGWALREYLQPFLLADAAHGVSYQQGGNGSDARIHATLVDAGLGCKVSLKNFRANLSWAYPLETSISDNPELEVGEEAKWYFDMQYSF